MQPYQGLDKASWINSGVRALIDLAGGLNRFGRGAAGQVWSSKRSLRSSRRSPSNSDDRVSRRRPEPGELVIIPEVHDDPLIFAPVAFSGCAVLLAPLGLFYWPFEGAASEGWPRSTVGRS